VRIEVVAHRWGGGREESRGVGEEERIVVVGARCLRGRDVLLQALELDCDAVVGLGEIGKELSDMVDAQEHGDGEEGRENEEDSSGRPFGAG
jgi:hypothetical protein